MSHDQLPIQIADVHIELPLEEHFSFLVQDAVISQQSPVIVTTPSAYHKTVLNVAIADNLYDFVGLGLRYGFSALVEFVWNQPEAIRP